MLLVYTNFVFIIVTEKVYRGVKCMFRADVQEAINFPHIGPSEVDDGSPFSQ